MVSRATPYNLLSTLHDAPCSRRCFACAICWGVTMSYLSEFVQSFRLHASTTMRSTTFCNRNAPPNETPKTTPITMTIDTGGTHHGSRSVMACPLRLGHRGRSQPRWGVRRPPSGSRRGSSMRRRSRHQSAISCCCWSLVIFVVRDLRGRGVCIRKNLPRSRRPFFRQW